MTTTLAAVDLQSAIARMPKVELHRHLEGAVRFETLAAVVAQADADLPRSVTALRALVQVQTGQPRTAQNFLSKFDVLRQVYRSPAAIQRVVGEVIEDAARDGVWYLELHFTPAALVSVRGYALREAFDWVVEATRRAEERTGIQVRLIPSVNRHESVDLAERVVELAATFRGCVLGVGLAGNEAEFPAEPFRAVLAEARQSGLGVTIHAGEWAGADSVAEAVERLGADRISHGVRVMEDPNVVALARERNVVFETCLTSNVHSGVVPRIEDHPLGAMIDAGLRVTVNTDDPTISAITLSDEYRTAVESLGLSLHSLPGLVLAAAQGSFLADKEKAGLERALTSALLAE